MRNIKIGSLALMLCAISTVAAGKEHKQTLQKAANADVKAANGDPAYVIGPEDVLKIDVFKEADLSGSVPVRPDGNVSIPLIHDVQAEGLTPNQLAESIASKLKQYLEQPEVTVVVTQVNKRLVYVMGEVSHAGSLPLAPGMTVLQALATSGGVTEFANRKAIYVLRTENGVTSRLPFNYKKAIRGDAESFNLRLRAGDTIIVP